MNELLRLLQQKINIKNLCIYSREDTTAETLISILAVLKLENLYIISNDYVRASFEDMIDEFSECDDFSDKTLPNISYFMPNEDLGFTLENETDALVFDSSENIDDILALSNLKPYNLIGFTFDSSEDAFTIWETYRKVSHSIDIISYPDGFNPQAMQWEKRDSDIELSVVFPMYNVAPYLDQCVKSVTEWDADYIELLFVDDGSPDNSAEIIEGYAKNDPRIKLIRKPNGGCASARQKGMEEAKGRYIGFIDPDDFIDPSMFRKLLRAALIGNFQMAYCGYKEYYQSNGQSKVAPDLIGAPYMYGTTNPDDIRDLACYMRVAIWRGIYSMDMINNAGIHFYTDLRRFDDLPFKMETLAATKSVVSVPEHLYYYRLNRPGQDVTANDDRLYVHEPIFKYLDEFFKKAGKKELVDALQICKIHTHIYAIEKIENKYLKGYLKLAQKDLDGYGYKRSKMLYSQAIARSARMYHKLIHYKSTMLIKMFKARQRRKQKAGADIQAAILNNIKNATK